LRLFAHPELCICAESRTAEDVPDEGISDGNNAAVRGYLEKAIDDLSLGSGLESGFGSGIELGFESVRGSGLEPGLGSGIASDNSLSSFSLEQYEEEGIFRYRSEALEETAGRIRAAQKLYFPLPSAEAEKARRGAVGRRAVDDGMKFEGNRLHALMTRAVYQCWDDAYVLAAGSDDVDADPFEYCRFVETAMWVLEQDFKDQWWSRSGFEKPDEGTTYDACFDQGKAIAEGIVHQYFRAANAAYVRKVAGDLGDVNSMVPKLYMEAVFGDDAFAIPQREE
ncbi:hypothetical protein KY362_04470, partial [Candidatus Woesearchaeota archaeon]|nr:hypothetical protein [Candidatus Woesearchaeota archaeon]